MAGEERPTTEVRKAVNKLLRRNGRTAGAEVGEMYLGKDILVVRLKRPTVIEGEWRDVDRTVDLFDLMDLHESEGS
jgi:hypothetical protein